MQANQLSRKVKGCPTLSCTLAKVKRNYAFYVQLLLLISMPLAAHAETEKELAIQNATYLTTMLMGTAPGFDARLVRRIADGSLQRPAPKQPIWILNSDTQSILYYQGKPEFTGKPAVDLVDDTGSRFGLKALDWLKIAKSGWLSMTLAGKRYSAYCHTKTPYAVCSLVP